MDCELCVVGAGISGLNALYSAKSYLPNGARVVVLDRRAAPGGMWNDTYGYVRLHQPHPLFTVGTIPWKLPRPRQHLASKSEVVDHLHHCATEVFADLNVTLRWGTEYVSHDEVNGGAVVRARTEDGAPLEVRAALLIKSVGFDVRQLEPLRFSSDAVRGSSPHDEAMLDDTAPVYLIGSGKTAMDTAAALLDRQPKREVVMVLGSGTVFLDRARAFPHGAAALFKGTTGLRVAIDTAMHFDGTNAEANAAHFRDHHGLCLHPDSKHYAFGILSPEELERVRRGLRSTIPGHVRDIEDGDQGPELVLTDGSRHEVAEGVWVVNCTGYLELNHDYEPMRSRGGSVLSVTPRSALHLLTTHSGYLLPHLHFLGLLDRIPIYELDVPELRRRDKVAWPSVVYTHALYNMLQVLGALPPAVVRNMGINFDNWYPLPRRPWDFAHVRLHGARYVEHCRKVLDRVREQHEGLHCGPLPRP